MLSLPSNSVPEEILNGINIPPYWKRCVLTFPEAFEFDDVVFLNLMSVFGNPLDDPLISTVERDGRQVIVTNAVVSSTADAHSNIRIYIAWLVSVGGSYEFFRAV